MFEVTLSSGFVNESGDLVVEGFNQSRGQSELKEGRDFFKVTLNSFLVEVFRRCTDEVTTSFEHFLPAFPPDAIHYDELRRGLRSNPP